MAPVQKIINSSYNKSELPLIMLTHQLSSKASQFLSADFALACIVLAHVILLPDGIFQCNKHSCGLLLTHWIAANEVQSHRTSSIRRCSYCIFPSAKTSGNYSRAATTWGQQKKRFHSIKTACILYMYAMINLNFLAETLFLHCF